MQRKARTTANDNSQVDQTSGPVGSMSDQPAEIELASRR
jgi:hypothetical protein